MSPRTTLLFISKWLLAAGLLAACIAIAGVDQLVALARTLPWEAVATVALLTVAARALLSEIQRKVLRQVGLQLGPVRFLRLAWLKGYLNLFVPSGGTGVLALYLNRELGLPYRNYLLGLLPATLAQLTIGALLTLGLFTALLYTRLAGPTPEIILAALVALGLVYAALRLLPPALKRLWVWRRHDPTDFEQVWGRVHSKGLLLRLLVMSLGLYLVRAIRLWLIFHYTGHSVDWVAVLAITAAADVATTFNVTPGGIGLREGVLGLGATLSGTTLDAVLGAALIERLIAIATIVAVAQPLLWSILKRKRGHLSHGLQ